MSGSWHGGHLQPVYVPGPLELAAHPPHCAGRTAEKIVRASRETRPRANKPTNKPRPRPPGPGDLDDHDDPEEAEVPPSVRAIRVDGSCAAE